MEIVAARPRFHLILSALSSRTMLQRQWEGMVRDLPVYYGNCCRPAPLPPDFECLVIPNHVAKAVGRNGEGSHSRKEPNNYLSLVGKQPAQMAIGE
jgi:hypothetical protein